MSERGEQARPWHCYLSDGVTATVWPTGSKRGDWKGTNIVPCIVYTNGDGGEWFGEDDDALVAEELLRRLRLVTEALRCARDYHDARDAVANPPRCASDNELLAAARTRYLAAIKALPKSLP